MTSAERELTPSLAEMAKAMNVVLEGMLSHSFSLEDAVRVFERRYVEAAVARYGGNIQQTAAALQIHRNTLRRKLRRLPPPSR
ncbi:MAG: helix-turn-helix domain-containing protein [Thermoanaerobaculaceae bacterium]